MNFLQQCLTLLCAAILTLKGGLITAAEKSPSRTIKLPAVKSGETGHPAFMSPHFRPVAHHEGLVYVTNTPADTVDVIDAGSGEINRRIAVGVNPSGLAIRPDGQELWVTNHISDSVSVIDIRAASPTRHAVIATIQEIDPVTRATRFDEPVGIAFAGNDKAYITLSTENQVAVVDTRTRKIVNRLKIPAQDPRAIAVHGNRLYVAAFESNNQTQLSGGTGRLDGNLKTFDIYEHSVRNNNVLSLKAVVDIVKNPKVPDRDLFIFDTNTDRPIEVVSGLGTLLYGMAVDGQGTVYIAQTDARNDVNGRAGTRKHGLKELENRPFLNRITRVAPADGKYQKVSFIDLEPLPPAQPARSEARATPYAVSVAEDGRTLFVTAAGSDKFMAIDTASGKILSEASTGAVPEGATISMAEGKTHRAWVYNAAENSVSVIDISDPRAMKTAATIALHDPTEAVVKRGRIAFSSASASSTGTFSCASCHPDGNTDQLLWVLNTPIVTGGDQVQPRSSMPIRGLRDTAPFHWDGIPGDPYGGINSASVHKAVAPNSKPDEPSSSTRHLVDGGLASTMLKEGDPARNDEDKAGYLSAVQREDMARFLLSVPFPPAQRRAYDNNLSANARRGFSLFHIEGDLDPTKKSPNVCGDCHRLPFLVSTNTPGTGMDAPTWRGAYDRWLILPQGRLNVIDLDFYQRVAMNGNDERSIWQFSWAGRRRFDPIWDMVLEGSTGFPGAYARQLTLDKETATDKSVLDLFSALVESARQGQTLLQADGVRLEITGSENFNVEFDPDFAGGAFVNRSGEAAAWPVSQLVKMAVEGRLVATFTSRIGSSVGYDNPQPALWTRGPIQIQRGHQRFPNLVSGNLEMKLSGRHINPVAILLVDGRKVEGKISVSSEDVSVTLAELPAPGIHFLQIQNRNGLTSNEFIFTVGQSESAAGQTVLGEILRKNGWEKLLGEWVDEPSGGQGMKMSFRWRETGKLLESVNDEGGRLSTSLITFDADQKKIIQVGVDKDGKAFKGQWIFSEGGRARLAVRGLDANPDDAALNFSMSVENDKMTIYVETDQPTAIPFRRKR